MPLNVKPAVSAIVSEAEGRQRVIGQLGFQPRSHSREFRLRRLGPWQKNGIRPSLGERAWPPAILFPLTPVACLDFGLPRHWSVNPSGWSE